MKSPRPPAYFFFFKKKKKKPIVVLTPHMMLTRFLFFEALPTLPEQIHAKPRNRNKL